MAVQQLDKCNWQIECVPSQPLLLSYEVYAFDNSVRTAWLDTQRGFFNGTSLCLRVHDQEDAVHALELVAPRSACRTGKPPPACCRRRSGKRGFGIYLAADYDELVDCPVEMGTFWSAEFKAGGVPHRFVVAGASESFDGARLLDDVAAHLRNARSASGMTASGRCTRATCSCSMPSTTAMAAWSIATRTALIASRRDLPRLGDARIERRLHHAAGAGQPRVLPHLERQAPATGGVLALRLHRRELHPAALVLRGLHQLLRRPAAAALPD